MSGLSLSGFVQFFGLLAGVYTGVLLWRWRVQREVKSGAVYRYERKPGEVLVSAKVRPRWRQPVIALLVLLVALAILEIYLAQGQTKVGIYMLFGLAIGFILQRSGFCVAASFRDIFTSGGGRQARGMIVAIAVAMLGFSVLVYTGVRQPYVLPVGWHTLLGAYIFGVGMVVAGGCASGTLSRIGEGSVQLMFALLGAILAASLFSVLLKAIEFKMSTPIWLVDKLGWQGALLVGFSFLGVWLVIVQWNENRRRMIR